MCDMDMVMVGGGAWQCNGNGNGRQWIGGTWHIHIHMHDGQVTDKPNSQSTHSLTRNHSATDCNVHTRSLKLTASATRATCHLCLCASLYVYEPVPPSLLLLSSSVRLCKVPPRTVPCVRALCTCTRIS